MPAKATEVDAADAADVEERLTARLQNAEARLAGLDADVNRLKLTLTGGDGSAPASHRRPVRFTDPIEGPPGSVVLVRSDVLATGADELRALLDERTRVIGELRELRRRRRNTYATLARAQELKRGLHRPFPGGPVGRHPHEDDAPRRIEEARGEITTLTSAINTRKERLAAIFDRIRHEWTPIRLGAPVVTEADPDATARVRGERDDE